MTLHCPECGGLLDGNELRCPNRHTIKQKSGVVRLIASSFEATLDQLEKNIQRLRRDENRRITTPEVYAGLPQNLASAGDVEWQIRCHDLRNILRRLKGRTRLRVLDLGAWNGWLSYRLTLEGHDVTAADYFSDEFDGLAAMNHYPAAWNCIQMDLGELAVLGGGFDVVVVNHGLAFFDDPIRHVNSAIGKLNPGGILIALGLKFYKDTSVRQAEVVRMCQEFRERYGVDLFFRPTRALLDWDDRTRLKNIGMQVVPYRELWRRNLKALLQPTRPQYAYGIFHAR